MANEYLFVIDADDDKGVPFGPVNKDNMDISRLLIDFSCWLDPSESITTLEHLMVTAELPALVPPWRANYPLDETTATPIPTDLYPLTFYRNNILKLGTVVALEMTAGTPGLTYVVSFVAKAGVSLRKREVDILLVIDRPLNPNMVALGESIPTYEYPLFITMSTELPVGLHGRVYINNLQAAPITVTLPPSPVLGDVVSVLDYGMTATPYPVTFLGAYGSETFSIPELPGPDPCAPAETFVSNISGDDLTFEWTGMYWAVGTKLFPILG